MPAHDYKQSSTFYNDITAATIDFLTDHRFTLEVAQATANNVCNMIRDSFGGEILYIKRETISSSSNNDEFNHLFILVYVICGHETCALLIPERCDQRTTVLDKHRSTVALFLG